MANLHVKVLPDGWGKIARSQYEKEKIDESDQRFYRAGPGEKEDVQLFRFTVEYRISLAAKPGVEYFTESGSFTSQGDELHWTRDEDAEGWVVPGAEGLLSSDIGSLVPAPILTALARAARQARDPQAKVEWDLSREAFLDFTVEAVLSYRDGRKFFAQFEQDFGRWMTEPYPQGR